MVSKTGELDWTSLSGNAIKKVLKHLPEKILFCLHDDTSNLVISLWKEFESVYTVITEKQNEPFKAETVFETTQSFMTHFVELGKKKRKGYQPSLPKFTGQGV